MTQLQYGCVSLFTLVLLTACNGAGILSKEHEQQVTRLEAAMVLCASSSAENQQQLRLQLEQLQRQGKKLDAISELQAGVVADTAQIQNQAQAQAQAPVENPVERSECKLVETEPSKMVVGRQEQVWLEDIQLALPARVDTGAETASLDAHNIELFERNSKRWVRFEIVHPDTGEALQLERKLKRTVSIIQSNTSEAERRPVIKLGITIGHIKQSAEFTLSNRSHLDYQLLIGRNILKDVMIVDVSRINIAPPVLGE
jgi:hypothetical protein